MRSLGDAPHAPHHIRSCPSGSSPVVGSSRSSTAGLPRTLSAKLSCKGEEPRRRWPGRAGQGTRPVLAWGCSGGARPRPILPSSSPLPVRPWRGAPSGPAASARPPACGKRGVRPAAACSGRGVRGGEAASQNRRFGREFK